MTMSITFTLNFTSVTDKSYSLNSRVARLAAVPAGNTGELSTVSGVTGSTGTVTWSLAGAPAWLTINSAGTVSYSGVDTAKIGVYNFSIVATDSSNSSNSTIYPITVEVLPAFFLKEAGGLTTIAANILDATVSNTIHGYGADGTTVLTDVKFSVVGSLPNGLSLRTTKDDAYLFADLKTLTDIRGGIKTVGSSQSVQLRAFKEGTFHDHPDRAATLTLTYNVSDISTGDIDLAINAYVDSTTATPTVKLHVRGDIKSGKGSISGYSWGVTGSATGSFISSTTGDTVYYVPSSNGQLTFTVTATGSGTTSPTYTQSYTIDVASTSSWAATPKLKMYPAPSYTGQVEQQGYSSQVVSFGILLPDIASGQTATVTPTVTNMGSAPSASTPTMTVNGTPTSSYTDTNSTNGDIALLSFTVPSGAVIGDKWLISISATTGTRTGTMQYYVLCTGAQSIVVTPADSSISMNTGTQYSSGTPISTVSSSQSSTVYSLINAPEGIYVDASGNIIGKTYKPTSGSLKIYYSKAGFSTGITSTITYVVNESGIILSPVLSTSTPIVAPGSNVTVNWSFTGTATNFYLKKDNEAEIMLSGTTTTYNLNITTNSVIGLRAVSSVGESFAAPISIQASSTGIVSRIPQSPTIAYLYQDNTIDLNWSPVLLSPDPYGSYAYWNVWYKYTSSILTDGILYGTFTGLEDPLGTNATRVAKMTLVPGPSSSDAVFLDMQAISTNETTVLSSFRWNKSDINTPFNLLQFPTFGTVVLDKNTASKNEPIKVTVSGFTGDRWRIVFQDGTATPFQALGSNSIVISFSVGGQAQNIRIEVENDYSTYTPSVRLRSVIKQDLFIIDQDYAGTSTQEPLGNVGLGGNQGFEITNNTDGEAPLDPYMTVVRSLVKDENTNELKLMLATARTQDGSSSFGTMAIDVFPILGRPHIKDLIKPLPSTTYTSEILTPVSVTTNLLEDVIIGKYVEIKLSANGGKTPYSWYATSLPEGLSMSTDGTIYGSVYSLGSTDINVSVIDSSEPSFISEKKLNLYVKSDIAIATTVLPVAQVASDYNQALSVTGGIGPFEWQLVSGELPEGLFLDGATGVISGVTSSYNSTTDMSRVYTFIVQVKDSVGAITSKQLTMTIKAAPLTISALDQVVIYRGEKTRVIAKIYGGVSPYSNLIVTDSNGIVTTSNAHIKDGIIEINIPETVNVGNYNFAVTVTDASTATVSKTLEYTVRPYLGEVRIVDSYVDNIYNTTENANHYVYLNNVVGSTLTLNTSTPLPNGVTLSYNDSTRALNIKGPATAGNNTEFVASFTVAGTSFNGVIEKKFSLTSYTGQFVSGTPAEFNISMLPIRVGSLIALDFKRPYFNTATSTSPSGSIHRVKAGYKLPTGLSLDANTGMIYGKVSSTTTTLSKIELVDSLNNVLSTYNLTFQLYGKDTLILDTSNLGVAKRGTAYTGTIQVLDPGTSPVSITVIKGQLPPGLTFSTSGLTISLTGTPTAGGAYDFWYRILDAAGKSAIGYKRMEVNYSNAVNLQTSSVPTIIAGVPYSFQLTSVGGVTPYTYSIASGTLPAGISLSSTGLISGTTTNPSYSANVTISVTDSNATTDSKVYAVKTDPGYTIQTVTGTASVGNWPSDQKDLSTIVRLNDPANSSLRAFTVKITGIDSPTGTVVSVNDPNLAVSLSVVTEGGVLVGYAKITNPAKTSPATLGISGVRNFNLTVSNPASGRSKTQALTYTILNAGGATMGAVSKDGLDRVTPAAGIKEFAFIETVAAGIYCTSNTSAPYTQYICGLDLAATPMDVVSNNVVVFDNTSGLTGKFIISQDSIIGSYPVISVNYNGLEFGTPVTGQSVTMRVRDVAYINTTPISTGKYIMDVFAGDTTPSPRETNIKIRQLTKIDVVSNTPGIFVDENYTYQINFDAPPDVYQALNITHSGFTGVTGTEFVYNSSGQIVGFRVKGLWPKNNSLTYPFQTTVNFTMTETDPYTRNSGNSSPATITHFNKNFILNVAVNSNALNATLVADDSSYWVNGQFNLYSPYSYYNQNPTSYLIKPPTVTLQNYVSSADYRIKVVGDEPTNPFVGYSKLNLPNNIRFYCKGNDTYYSIGDMFYNLSSSGLLVKSQTSSNELLEIRSYPASSPYMDPTIGYNMWEYPAPAVPTATDYSTQSAIIANAIPIARTTVRVKITVQEVSSGKTATNYGTFTMQPACGSDPYYNSFMILRHLPSGVSTTPDTFQVIGYYYDSSNPNDYQSSDFFAGAPWPLYDVANTGLGPHTFYIVGHIPYLTSKTETFSRMTTTGAGITITNTTSSSDAIMTKAATYGLNLFNPATLVSTFYSKFFADAYNSYSVTLPDTSNYQFTVDVYAGSQADPYYSNWLNASGMKQGRIKFKPVKFNIHGAVDTTGGGTTGPGGGCVPPYALITMGDNSLVEAGNVKINDVVMTYNNVTGAPEPKRVTAIHNKGIQQLVRVEYSEHVALMSTTHRVYLADEATYIEAKSLKAGDYVMTPSGQDVVSRVEILNVYEPVMTFSVEQNRNYYADGILAHNYKPTDCVPAGSKVLMADGSTKNIEDLKAGDKIISYNEQTKDFDVDSVHSTYKTEIVKRLLLTLVDGTVLEMTGNHTLLLEDGSWIQASSIEPGVKISRYDNGSIKMVEVVSVIETVATDDPWVYLGEITRNHTLVVDSMVCHNKINTKTTDPYA